MKKLSTFILVTIVVLSMYTCVAKAATLDPIEPDNTQPMIITASDEDIDILAQLVWAEARGVDSKAEQAAVIWCALNRVDDERWPDTIAEVVTQPGQFAYSKHDPVTTELRELAKDVVSRWIDEKLGAAEVGRVLPREYVFFAGRHGHNRFRTAYEGNGEYWDWSLPNPYEEA